MPEHAAMDTSMFEGTPQALQQTLYTKYHLQRRQKAPFSSTFAPHSKRSGCAAGNPHVG